MAAVALTGSPILVTGSTGRIGAEVIQGLIARGRRVRALVRDVKRATHLAAQGAELIEGDLRQPASLKAACAGVERAFLVSADALDQEQMEGALIAEAARAGAQHLVKVSAQSAGLPAPVSFGVVHRKIEQSLERSGLSFTVLRPTFFQQSLLLFADDIRRKGAFAAPARRARIAMVDCRDVADVAVHCLLHPGKQQQVLTLTGPEAHSLPEIAGMLSELRGQPVRHRALPAPIARLLLPFVSGMPRWQSNLVIDLFQALERGAQESVSDDVSQVLGRPARGVRAFLEERASAFGLTMPAPTATGDTRAA